MISIVVPIFNEEEIVELFHVALTDSMKGEAWEVVYVNDGSRDSSLRLLTELQAKDPHVVVVDLSRNWGHMGAISAGLQTAIGDAVAARDEDAAYDENDTLLVTINDDMPFLFDSLIAEVTSAGGRLRAVFHPIIERDGEPVSVIALVLEPVVSEAGRHAIVHGAKATLAQVRVAVRDWRPMAARAKEAIAVIETAVRDILRSPARCGTSGQPPSMTMGGRRRPQVGPRREWWP